MHYRATILIFASNNNEIFCNCRKIWKQYMNIDPTIKVYFVYGELSKPLNDYDPSSDLIYNEVKGDSMYIERTIKAIKYIDSQITYDFFIRTNLSTFWDFKNLHLHLNVLPSKNCYSGDGPLPGYNSDGYYLSGTDTIVTPEMIKYMIYNENLINYNIVEDAAMGLFFNGILKAPMLPNRICFFEDILLNDDPLKIETRIQNAIQNNRDHYRVKSQCDREQMDMIIYIKLLKYIYNIDFK